MHKLMTDTRFLLLFLAALLFTACGDSSRPDTPEEPPVADSLLTLGRLHNHGQWYPQLERNVLSLDLYSPGLSFNERGFIEGTGTNLYFSDIFVNLTDTLLPFGTFTVDTTTNVQTALPGVSYDNTVAGAYLLLIEESNLQRIILIKEGTFRVATNDTALTITFDLTTQDDQAYHATYVGNLE